MLDFILANYIIFIVIGIVLLLGLFGYMMDKKKYNDYREEILNEDKAIETLESNPNIQEVVTPITVQDTQVPETSNDPLTGQN
ncbi:MAG: hypothetical protein J5982_04120 [Bacilli bacterium]|nr:hypothetical protein [Bacilli bacterium]